MAPECQTGSFQMAVGSGFCQRAHVTDQTLQNRFGSERCFRRKFVAIQNISTIIDGSHLDVGAAYIHSDYVVLHGLDIILNEYKKDRDQRIKDQRIKGSRSKDQRFKGSKVKRKNEASVAGIPVISGLLQFRKETGMEVRRLPAMLSLAVQTNLRAPAQSALCQANSGFVGRISGTCSDANRDGLLCCGKKQWNPARLTSGNPMQPCRWKSPPIFQSPG
jgi:hypothetical protein